MRKAAVAFDRVRGNALPRDASRDLILKVADEQWKTLGWRRHKSSRSGNGGGQCVEVGTAWRKSSHSGNGGAECVEVASNLRHVVAVRDSKDPDGPVLMISTDEWTRFIARVRATA
ncbi:MAG TPA: DUF397 domain-containing protein [Streptosporangiaceae bacterium]